MQCFCTYSICKVVTYFLYSTMALNVLHFLALSSWTTFHSNDNKNRTAMSKLI